MKVRQCSKTEDPPLLDPGNLGPPRKASRSYQQPVKMNLFPAGHPDHSRSRVDRLCPAEYRLDPQCFEEPGRPEPDIVPPVEKIEI